MGSSVSKITFLLTEIHYKNILQHYETFPNNNHGLIYQLRFRLHFLAEEKSIK